MATSEDDELAARAADTLKAEVIALRASTGVGKTSETAEHLRTELANNPELRIGIAAPTHALARQIMDRYFKPYGISTGVILGRSQDDPDRSGAKMCLEPERVDAVIKAGLPVAESCCKHGEFECDHFKVCGYQRQWSQDVQVLGFPHQYLFHVSRMPPRDLVVIDENFVQAGLRVGKAALQLKVSDIDRKDTAYIEEGTAAEIRERRKARRVDRRAGRTPAAPNRRLKYVARPARLKLRGIVERAIKRALAADPAARTVYLTRASFAEAGLTAEMCRHAIPQEYSRARSIRPRMAIDALKKAVSADGGGDPYTRATIWRLLAEFLEPDADDEAESGHLTVRGPNDEMEWFLTASWQMPIVSQLAEVPTYIIDALFSLPLARLYYPEVKLVADITAAMPAATTVTIVPDAPTSASKLKPLAPRRRKTAPIAATPPPRKGVASLSLRNVRRFILNMANRFPGKRSMVVLQKEFEAMLHDRDVFPDAMPPGIVTGHFNAVAGLDDYQGCPRHDCRRTAVAAALRDRGPGRRGDWLATEAAAAR